MSDGDHWWRVLMMVSVARYGYRGQRVGEVSHTGPVRRLRRTADARNVFPRLATQSTVADSDDDRPLVHVSSPHHEVTDPVQELQSQSDAEPRSPVRPSRRPGQAPDQFEGYGTGPMLGHACSAPGPRARKDDMPWSEWVLSCPWIPPTSATVFFRWDESLLSATTEKAQQEGPFWERERHTKGHGGPNRSLCEPEEAWGQFRHRPMQ